MAGRRRGGKHGPGGGRAARASGGISIGLAVVAALVLAFIVSAIAGIDGEDDDVAPGAAASHVADPPAPLPAVQPIDPALGHVRVEVLNGSGRGGLALDATRLLRADGFDVVFFGNAGRFDHDASVVLDRVGDGVRARAVAAALGIDSVATAVDSTLVLDASVVLGDDWPPAPPAPRPSLWQRIRGEGGG